MKPRSLIVLSLILCLFPFNAVLISPATAQNPVLNIKEFEISPQLQQAIQSENWQKAIELVDKLISIELEPQKLSDLREYRVSLQRKSANNIQAQKSPQEELKPVPEVVSQPPIPKPQIDLNAPPSPWAKIKLQKILKAQTPIRGAAISPSGKTLVTGGERTLEIWDLSTDKSWSIVDWIPKWYPIIYDAISFHPNGQTFITNSVGIAKKTSNSDNDCKNHQTPGSFGFSCKSSVTSSETISIGGSATQVWNVESGKQLLTFPTLGGEFSSVNGELISSVNMVSFNQEGTVLLAIKGNLFPAEIQDASTGKQLLSFSSKGFLYCHNATPVSPDGKLVAFVKFGSESVNLYNVQTGKKVTSLTNPEFIAVQGCPSFSPNGQMLVFASSKRVTVWWLPTGEVLHDISTSAGTEVYAQAAVFSPDSQVLAVGNTEQAIALYDMRSGKQIITLSGSFVGFHPNSNSLITTEGSNLKIWGVP